MAMIGRIEIARQYSPCTTRETLYLIARMSGLELNKIVGAILLVLLTAQVISTLGDALVHPRAHGPAAVTASAPVTTTPREIKIEPVSGLIAAASPDNGKKVAAKCIACHTMEKGGAHKIGPNLYGIIGHGIAQQPGFAYSNAMKAKGGTWDYETLNSFTAAPAKIVPGTKMTFVGLDKVKERADLLAYMRTLSDNPPPVPAAQAEAPAAAPAPAAPAPQ
jgi:cytochrome c